MVVCSKYLLIKQTPTCPKIVFRKNCPNFVCPKHYARKTNYFGKNIIIVFENKRRLKTLGSYGS